MITGNKGEWSEIYTLLKLLGEGKVYAGDENLQKIEELFYPIVKILRHQRENHYDYCLDSSNVVVQTVEGDILLKIPACTFLTEATYLLDAIKNGTGVFAVSRTEKFMKQIFCQTFKASSKDKADIHIVLHDRRTRMNSELGFSIKSQLGGDSTLLNAGLTTNFVYKIVGKSLNDKDIEEINTIEGRNKILDRVEKIRKKGGELVFDKVDSEVFHTNLSMLDGDLAQIVALLLLERIESDDTYLKPLTEKIAKKNPFGFDADHAMAIYSYKVKHLLTSVALGMMPGTFFTGRYDATGGYLVVKRDGEIVCYHFYDRNRFEDYLFSNAYLERASTTRHQYGKVFIDSDGEIKFKLNLQIRLR